MASHKQDPPILLLIDLQHGLVEGPPEWGPRSTPTLVENVKLLLSTWREKSWPIIHVYHDDLLENGNPISSKYPVTFAPHVCAAPLATEKVFIKHVGSPFVATGLLDEISKLGGTRKVVVIGMDGGQCVNSTTRNGADLELKMVVVGDACATYGMDDWKTAENIGAEETHAAAMSMLTAYAKVFSTEKLLASLDVKG